MAKELEFNEALNYVFQRDSIEETPLKRLHCLFRGFASASPSLSCKPHNPSLLDNFVFRRFFFLPHSVHQYWAKSENKLSAKASVHLPADCAYYFVYKRWTARKLITMDDFIAAEHAWQQQNHSTPRRLPLNSKKTFKIRAVPCFNGFGWIKMDWQSPWFKDSFPDALSPS